VWPNVATPKSMVAVPSPLNVVSGRPAGNQRSGYLAHATLAAVPGDGRVLSSPAWRVHEPGTFTRAVVQRSQPGLTGSGSHRHSDGGFGGGHRAFTRIPAAGTPIRFSAGRSPSYDRHGSGLSEGPSGGSPGRVGRRVSAPSAAG
jgi:hypothetical protein